MAESVLPDPDTMNQVNDASNAIGVGGGIVGVIGAAFTLFGKPISQWFGRSNRQEQARLKSEREHRLDMRKLDEERREAERLAIKMQVDSLGQIANQMRQTSEMNATIMNGMKEIAAGKNAALQSLHTVVHEARDLVKEVRQLAREQRADRGNDAVG
jgi:gas vesicle protein